MTTNTKTTQKAIETPELDKVLAVQEESHAIAEFIDFLKQRGYDMKFDVSDELARFYGIDRVKAELERGRLWASIKTQIN